MEQQILALKILYDISVAKFNVLLVNLYLGYLNCVMKLPIFTKKKSTKIQYFQEAVHKFCNAKNGNFDSLTPLPHLLQYCVSAIPLLLHNVSTPPYFNNHMYYKQQNIIT